MSRFYNYPEAEELQNDDVFLIDGETDGTRKIPANKMADFFGEQVPTDKTLSIENKAADAKKTGDEIGELKSDINYVLAGQKSVSASEIIQGTYNSAGAVVINANRIRTNGFIDVKKGEKIVFTPSTNVHEIFVGYFSTSGAFIRDGSWLPSLSMKFDNDYKIILVFRRENTTQAIVPSNYDASTVFYTSNTEQLSEIAAKEETVARYEQLFTATRFSAGDEWYLEEDKDNRYCYVKAYPYFVVRGGWTGGDAYTVQWSSVVTDLSSYIATSPKGVTNCVRLQTDGIFLDIANKKVVYQQYRQYYPNYIPLVFCIDGRPLKGRVISDNLPWVNHSAIEVLSSKMADATYVPDSIKTGLISVNDVATYSYPNMAKILWISDVHWNNDCFAYLKYLADLGQYDALIISGDLNYYQFEQTLEATKTGMSELARLWNNYYRGKTVVLPCRGNHDGHVGYSDYTSEMFANAVIKPFQDCEPNGYYYYDIDKYRLRIVMLNSCDDAQGRKGFTSAGVTWFQNTLASVQDGWSVISVSHHPIVQDINNETTLAGNSAAIVSAIQSFITSKPNCYFIAHLSGHTHIDAMEKVNGVEYVSLIDSSTDNSDYSADIICINQTTQTVNLLRSGQGSDRQFTY